MAKKKKKKSLKSREMQQEAKEELEVLTAIFGDQFTLDEDARGFALQIVPHPGRTDPNYVSVPLAARQAKCKDCVWSNPTRATDSCCMRLQFVNNSSTHISCCPHRCRKCCCQLLCATVRYPVDYPHQPLVLKVTSTKGLTASDTRSLTKLLNSASAEHARDKVVAGFSIADACQEFLLSKNNPEAAEIDRTVQEAVPGNLF